MPRSVLIASAVALDTTANTTPINLQSSGQNPPIYETGNNQAVDATNDTPAVFTGADVGYPNNTAVTLGGTPPAGFTADTTYYVVNADVSAKTFELAATVGGSSIDSSDTGTDVTAFAANYNVGTGANGGYDKAAAPGFPFTSGNTIVVEINSGAGQAGTVMAVQTADEGAGTPGVPGSFTTVASVTGISTLQLFSIVLKQFIRVAVTTAASEAGTGAATLIG